MLNNLENIIGARKRKERQIWKLDENIQELRSGISETKDLLMKLNRQINKLASKMEEHMSKNINRKVIVTKATF